VVAPTFVVRTLVARTTVCSYKRLRYDLVVHINVYGATGCGYIFCACIHCSHDYVFIHVFATAFSCAYILFSCKLLRMHVSVRTMISHTTLCLYMRLRERLVACICVCPCKWLRVHLLCVHDCSHNRVSVQACARTFGCARK